jgi:hypothetical protein
MRKQGHNSHCSVISMLRRKHLTLNLIAAVAIGVTGADVITYITVVI